MLLPVLGQYVTLYPTVWVSMFRTSVCIRLEDNKKVQRSRDRVFLLSLFPLCALLWQSGAFTSNWFTALSHPVRIVVLSAILAAFCLLRLGIEKALPHWKFSSKVYDAALGCQRSFVLVYVSILFLCLVFLSLLDASLLAHQVLIICLTALFYLLFLVRRFQIFACECNFLTAILYLCALELPTMALVVVLALVG